MYERKIENQWFHSTVQGLFHETCERNKKKTALVYEDRELSYEDLRISVYKTSQALIRLGIKRGDRVSILPTSSIEFTFVYFSVLQVGAIVNPLNLLWGEIEYRSILPRNDPKLIITIDKNGGRNYIKLLRDSIPDLEINGEGVLSASIPSLNYLISVSRDNSSHEGFIDFQQFQESGDDYDETGIVQLVKSATCEDIQFMCQTSGSTGLSKSVLWNHRPPLATAHFWLKGLALDERDTYLNMSPYYHNSGLSMINMMLVLKGTTVFLMENFDPHLAVDIIEKYRPNVTGGFDAHFRAIDAVLDNRDVEFTPTKFLGAVSTAVYDLIKNEMCKGRKILIANIYGQTENGPGVAIVESDCVSERIRRDTNGRPFPGVEIVIKDYSSSQKLGDGREGEICYRSPFMFSGYYKQEIETRKLFDEDGFIHSGDYGYLDGGYLKFIGRLGDIVKTGGENVSTIYVSESLLELFTGYFDDVLTIGIPDSYWGTKLVSWVRSTEGEQLKPSQELREKCKNLMAEYEIPKEFLEWKGAWPTTGVGKIDFDVLKTKAIEALENSDDMQST